jgi:hypothetical protein
MMTRSGDDMVEQTSPERGIVPNGSLARVVAVHTVVNHDCSRSWRAFDPSSAFLPGLRHHNAITCSICDHSLRMDRSPDVCAPVLCCFVPCPLTYDC